MRSDERPANFRRIEVLDTIGVESLVADSGLGYVIWNSWTVLSPMRSMAGLAMGGGPFLDPAAQLRLKSERSKRDLPLDDISVASPARLAYVATIAPLTTHAIAAAVGEPAAAG